MKVLSLRAENVKCIKIAEITPTDNVVNISGKNGSGKTSVLDSIEWALGGTDAIQAKPIRDGETSARIRLDLGDVIVTRRFTEKGSTVTVESADGARYPSPQAMLDKLYGAVSFDPLAFSRMKPRDQYEELRRISGVTLDIESLDRDNDADYRKRTELNRFAKEKSAVAVGYVFDHEPIVSPIDLAVIAAQMKAASDANAKLLAERNDRLRMIRQIASVRDEIASIEEQLESRRSELKSKIDAQVAWKDLGEEQDLQPFQEQIADGQSINAEFRRRQERDAIVKQVTEAEAQANLLTTAMRGREIQIAEAIASAKMPIEGISLGSGIVLFNGIPFDQASSGERLRTGVAIAMAGNPKLRVCLIRDASLLDDAGMKTVTDMANERDFQVWVESVSSDGKVGIVMEDGEVVGANTGSEPDRPATYTSIKRAEPKSETGPPFSIHAAIKDVRKRKSIAEKLGKAPAVQPLFADSSSEVEDLSY